MQHKLIYAAIRSMYPRRPDGHHCAWWHQRVRVPAVTVDGLPSNKVVAQPSLVRQFVFEGKIV